MPPDRLVRFLGGGSPARTPRKEVACGIWVIASYASASWSAVNNAMFVSAMGRLGPMCREGVIELARCFQAAPILGMTGDSQAQVEQCWRNMWRTRDRKYLILLMAGLAAKLYVLTTFVL